DMQAAARLLEDGAIGFAYVNQRQFAPAVEALRDVRLHLGKRPVFATAEKAVVLFRARERTAVAAGYFHPTYERKLLTAMTAQHVDLAIAIKGLEGTTNLALRSTAPRRRHRGDSRPSRCSRCSWRRSSP